MTPWGAAIDATASHINLGASMIYNHHEAKLQREWQSQENEKSRNFERLMWDLNNQYNTPSAQRARLEEAGLNPYLNTGTVGTGTSSPMGAPAPQGGSSPASIAPNGSTNFAGAFAQMEHLRNEAKSVDANAANQYAQAAKTGAEIFSMVFQKTGNIDMANEAARQFMPIMQGASWEDSPEGQRYGAMVDSARAQSQIDRVNAVIAEKYGEDKAYREIVKMDYEYQESVARVGLWSSIAKLNDSNIEVNRAKIKDLIASAYERFSHSELMQSLKLTYDESREWFIGNLMCDFLQNHADAGDRLAEYEGSKGVRALKRTEDYQDRRTWEEGLDHNYVTTTGRTVLGLANSAIPVVKEARAASKRKVPHMNSTIIEEGRNARGHKVTWKREYFNDYE